METDVRLTEALTALTAMQGTDALIVKKAILMANRDNLLFRRLVLVAVGKIKTGITTKKLEQSIFYRKKPEVPTDVSAMIRYYRENSKGRDKDIAVTQLFLQQCPRTYREFLRRLFCGEMSLDISPSTVQKIFGKKERKKNESTYFE